MYGRVASLALFNPPMSDSNNKKSFLFLTTERNLFCVLRYDELKGELITVASGDLSDRIGRPSECGQLCGVDPDCKLIGAHLYDGLFKIIPMDKTGQLREAFNLRLDELQVVDVKFLHGYSNSMPTIAVLYQDQKESRHVKTYSVDLKNKDLVPGPWHLNDVEGGTSLIIPVPQPLGGVVLVGETIIVYVDGSGGGNGSADNPKGKDPVSTGGATNTPTPMDKRSAVRMKAIATHAAPFTSSGFVDVDGSRVLLTDSAGVLHLLVLVHDGNSVKNLKLEPLGQTSIASSVSYLDNGVAFIGSAYGDSQLIKLHAKPIEVDQSDEANSHMVGVTPVSTGTSQPPQFVEILEHFTNLGPIVDFAVVDLDRYGAGEVVTCSGVAKDGTLRVVRNGVGIHERAAVELPGIKGCWNLRNGDDTSNDTFLVVTFMRETRVLAVEDDDENLDAAGESSLGEVEFSGFSVNEQTLWCGNVSGGFICQVTQTSVRLVCAKTGERRGQWTCGDDEKLKGASIVVASGNAKHVMLATSSGVLVCLAVGSGGDTGDAMDTDQHLTRVTSLVSAGGEVACLDCSSLGNDAGTDNCKEACAVGLWSAEVKTFSMPDLVELSNASLTDDVGMKGTGTQGTTNQEDTGDSSSSTSVPRSILFAKFQNAKAFLLVGLGDGGLVTFELSDSVFGKIEGSNNSSSAAITTKMSLGTKPVTLRQFKSKKQTHVFAGSDRPTVIYGNNDKLVFSNVNVGEVSYASGFDTKSFPDSLCLISDTLLTIGSVDAIQKLHVRTVPLGEQPRRIAHQQSTKTFMVLTQNEENNSSGHFVRLLCSTGYETKSSYKLKEFENDGAVCSLSFENDPNEYYVVGTAFTVPEEVEPTRGRILVFQVTNDQLTLVAEKDVKGAVYTLASFNGKVLAGINSKVQLFKWVVGGGDGGGSGGTTGGGTTAGTHTTTSPTTHELIGECSHHGHIVALYVSVKNDVIAVGDLMKSVSLLKYDPNESSITEIARDFNPNWMTAVDTLDEDSYLGAENSFNLFTLRKNSDASSDEDRSRLDVVGEFHTGEFINRFRKGSLVAKVPDASGSGASEVTVEHSTLFGTVNGVIGVIAKLSQQDFKFASEVEQAMNQVVSGIGGLSHSKYRSFHNEHQTRPCTQFVDGDLVERFLDLKPGKAKEVAKIMKSTAHDVTRKVEALQRVTH